MVRQLDICYLSQLSSSKTGVPYPRRVPESSTETGCVLVRHRDSYRLRQQDDGGSQQAPGRDRREAWDAFLLLRNFPLLHHNSLCVRLGPYTGHSVNDASHGYIRRNGCQGANIHGRERDGSLWTSWSHSRGGIVSSQDCGGFWRTGEG